MNNRMTIYFSKMYDDDLIRYLDPILKEHKFVDVARSLMRDGIKYRINSNVIQSNTFTNRPDLSNIKLTKLEVDQQELENRLDSF